eukprot:TRINITY_DN11789_c0_g1_i1.p1 TRINITY_DN11789_c0_g1~~TRINITY_DN11789_c0_g1_i1.p1  ORF type:complete len:331 (+),score=27.05 TRINITY_DN11789_c0_g1_i1:30-1022(+)
MCVKTVFSILVVFLSILVGFYVNTLHDSPHVPAEVIERDGGHAFVHPDGRLTEYFLTGDPEGIPVIYFHGAGSTGKSCTYMHESASLYHYRVIGISTPGYGATSPIPGRGYVDGARDAVAVLDHLGLTAPRSLHIMGISYGSGTAAALAQLIPLRVRSLQLVIPQWPSCPPYSIFQGAPLFGLLLNAPVLDRLYAYYIPMANLSLAEIMTAIAPEEVRMAEAVRPGVMGVVDREYRRSTAYHHEGSCELSRILRSRGGEVCDKMDVLRGMGSRVSVWVALKDAAANPFGAEYLKVVLPEARIMEFERGHLEMTIYLEVYWEEMKRNDALE